MSNVEDFRPEYSDDDAALLEEMMRQQRRPRRRKTRLCLNLPHLHRVCRLSTRINHPIRLSRSTRERLDQGDRFAKAPLWELSTRPGGKPRPGEDYEETEVRLIDQDLLEMYHLCWQTACLKQTLF